MQALTVGRNVACGLTVAGHVRCWGKLREERISAAWVFGDLICRGAGVDDLPASRDPARGVALSAHSDAAAAWLIGRDGRVYARDIEAHEDEHDDGTGVDRHWSHRLVDFGPGSATATQVVTADETPRHGVPNNFGCVLHPRGEITCKFGQPPELPEVSDHGRWTRRAKHGCALMTDGRVACWGDDRYGQAPPELRFPAMPVELAVTRNAGCARLTDGHVACWGANRQGLMGPPLTPCARDCAYQFCDQIPHVVPDLADVVRLRSGDESTCAITRSGRLVCWDTFSDRQWTCEKEGPF